MDGVASTRFVNSLRSASREDRDRRIREFLDGREVHDEEIKNRLTRLFLDECVLSSAVVFDIMCA